jgi:hypothetical protein
MFKQAISIGVLFAWWSSKEYSYYYYGSAALCWALVLFFSVSWSYTQSVGLLGRVISPSRGVYLHTEQHKHKIKAHNTDIHVLSGILTHDPSVRSSEDSSCLRHRGHCDRQRIELHSSKYEKSIRFVGLAVVTEVVMKSYGFWDTTPCSQLKVSLQVGEHIAFIEE